MFAISYSDKLLVFALGFITLFLIISEALSANIIVGAFKFPFGMEGNTDESTTLNPSIPKTLKCSSTTAFEPLPILQVPHG